MNDKSLLVIAGTSEIGRATALYFAERGWSILLAARNMAAADREARDIEVRTDQKVVLLQLDVLDSDLARVIDRMPFLPHAVICAVGELGQQKSAQIDPEEATRLMRVNFERPALLLGLLAQRFAERGSGVIVGISSVAGDRGRSSNYVYGSAKAGFTTFLSGLRGRFAGTGVRVITAKPGFIRTRMTQDMKLPAILTADPAQVARRIYQAVESSRVEVIYVPRIWRAIMTILRAVPERVFKHLRV
jgi:decaprenylphospho-beta-D-erythro-pentofuranosid-2-ulose 2-reductase